MENFALLIAVPFMLAAVALTLALSHVLRDAIGGRRIVWIFTGAMGAAFLLFLTYLPAITVNGAQQVSIEWVPQLELSLSFYLDGLSLLFALIITGIGALVILYTGYYFDDDIEALHFYVLLLAFSGAMLAMVLAGNIFVLFIAWEGTSILSFLLIGFKGRGAGEAYRESALAARVGAARALVITGGGGLALIVGLTVMGAAAGSTELADILATGNLQDHPWYAGFALLIMLACFTKSAQFPFHFWLPGAMSAPSPASAYLHSATMVKAGIYLLARLYPVLGNSSLWMHVLMGIGLTTMAVGALAAIRQRDLKGLLAYSTVSKLGALVALIGIPGGMGLKAALVGVLAHALYKGTLFLMAGVVEHSTGTRNLDQLGGLRRLMPGAAIIAVGAGVSMAGYPPFLGWVAKETLLDATLPAFPLTWLPIIVTTGASILTVVAALLYVWGVFFGQPTADAHYEEHFHAPSAGLLIGPAIMAALSLLAGLGLTALVDPLLTPALGKDPHLHLFPEDGFANTAFQLSLVVLIAGPVLFALRRMWLGLPELPLPRGVVVYDVVMGRIDGIGDFFLRAQNGRLRYYLVFILSAAAGLILIAQFVTGNLTHLSPLTITLANPAPDLLKLLLLGVALAAMFASITLRQHLLSALSLGVAGYAVGCIFLLEPAPDVALVQILVETLGTVLVIIMIARIPLHQRTAMIELAKQQTKAGVLRDIALSSLMGLIVGAFALSAITNRNQTLLTGSTISLWHIQNAYSKLEVNDVVAGIVTDFRGTDTLIEITVFALAGLGVLTLLTLPESGQLMRGKTITQVRQSLVIRYNPENRPDEENLEALQSRRAASRMSTPLTRFIAKLMLPFSLLIALSHILYGGSGPGDGFTAGVIGGLAVALWYIVFGYFEARERLNWLFPGRLIAAGLGVAFLNAIAPLFLGDAFLQIQLLGDAPAGLHLTTTLFFELGIFLTVFGSTSIIMEAIAHPREVETL